jgi:iduronate 2-sulfatase
VLLIVVDDLRPEIAAFGETFMKTPSIDRLAKEGAAFSRAYCQQAICGPTRNSFLSGRRPQRTKSWNFIDSFREVGPEWVSFPEFFKTHGYVTLGTGKTYHPGIPPNYDEPMSWSQDEPYYMAPNGYPQCKVDGWKGSLACPNDDAIETFGDWLDMNRTKTQLLKYGAASKAPGGKPFFLAFGAHRPHLPWNVPRKFWDMYPNTEDIALPSHEAAPKDMPPIAFTYECDGKTSLNCFGESHPIPFPAANTSLPDNATRSFRKAYYAAVSWTDSLIGELLDTLEREGLRESTVVALIGDHGWQLGEHNIWGKHTNFELGTRVPIVISSPAHAGGVVSNELVESVDLYPTIASLAGLPTPSDLDGVDLSPLVAGESGRWPAKAAAFSEYPRCPKNISTPWDDTSSCVHTKRTEFTSMGYSVRTDTFRYTVWLHWNGAKLQGDFTRPPIGAELYDHSGDTEEDFDAFENVNVASDPAQKANVGKLYAMAQAHWDGKGLVEATRAAVADANRAHTVKEEAVAMTREQRALRFEEWD